MNISSLSVPNAGRSRFSKALPTPPPGIDELQRTSSRVLPNAPPAPPPPEKSSTLTTKPSTTTLKSKGFNSPLPILPIMAEAPLPRPRAGPIARKPVGQLLSPQSTADTNKTSKAMKRKSSISSILSAYSRSSSDWAQMSSHESDFTKDSEPSYSPEREELNGLPPAPPKKGMETINGTISDRGSEVTTYTITNTFPPPPPMKDPSRPRTPSNAGHVGEYGQGNLASLSPKSVGSGGSPRGGREIWRRRASSSKSDASPIITELRLPGSNGSTASTFQTPAVKVDAPSFLPSIPPKSNGLPALPPPPPSKQQQQQQPPAAALPPKPTTLPTSLPGRNIRPVKKTELLDDGDNEMKKFMKFSKLKALIRRSGDSEDNGSKGLGSPQRNIEQQNAPDNKGSSGTDKPETPAKDRLIRKPSQQTVAAGETSLSPASRSHTPALPPKESGQRTGTPLSRRPVGAAPTRAPSLPSLKPEGEKKDVAAPNVQSTSVQPLSGLKPRNPVGSLPHPRQRQQQTQRTSPPQPDILSPVTSTAVETGNPVSTTIDAPSNQLSAPAAVLTDSYQPLEASNTNIPGYQDPVLKPVLPAVRESPEAGNLPSPPQFIPPSRTSPAADRGPVASTQPSTFNIERENAISATSWNMGSLEKIEGSGLGMSDAAAAAVARFPRIQNWAVESTADGVLPPKPLTDQNYRCFAKHAKMIGSRNTNYPLACQTCGVADMARRCVCAHCNLRVCIPCVEVLNANGRDLGATMSTLARQGRIRDWSQYPKRPADGSV